MGTYTEYWNTYQRRTRRNTLLILLFVAVGLPATAGIAWLVGKARGGDYPAGVQIALIVAWLVALTVFVLRSSRIDCPRCATRYTHTKAQRQCPSCALKILQGEP
jgi:hypothetical protein